MNPLQIRVSACTALSDRDRMHSCGSRIRRVMALLNTPWQSQTHHLSPPKPPDQQWILPSYRNLKTAVFNNCNTLQLSCSYCNVFQCTTNSKSLDGFITNQNPWKLFSKRKTSATPIDTEAIQISPGPALSLWWRIQQATYDLHSRNSNFVTILSPWALKNLEIRQDERSGPDSLCHLGNSALHH